MSEEIKKNNQVDIKDHFVLKANKVIIGFVLFFVFIEILLFFFDWIVVYRQIISSDDVVRKFDLTSENGTGTIFASLQTFCSAFILWLIFFVSKKNKKIAWSWWIIAVFFTYMAFDDTLSLHEGSGYSIRYILSSSFLKGVYGDFLMQIIEKFPSYSWQLLLGPFFVLMGFYIFYFLFKVLKGMKLRRYVFTALSLFAIAMAMDFSEGLSTPYHFAFIKNITLWETFTINHYWMVIEELFEMLGNTIFLFVFLRYLFNILKGCNILID